MKETCPTYLVPRFVHHLTFDEITGLVLCVEKLTEARLRLQDGTYETLSEDSVFMGSLRKSLTEAKRWRDFPYFNVAIREIESRYKI
ncbi:MAG TPA: hypothetical protein VJZ93_03245 [Candidatus Nanoarchaeia archaeon]|nr:hypothetical protein [Candidatus Nanoarchaeia archaeon]